MFCDFSQITVSNRRCVAARIRFIWFEPVRTTPAILSRQSVALRSFLVCLALHCVENLAVQPGPCPPSRRINFVQIAQICIVRPAIGGRFGVVNPPGLVLTTVSDNKAHLQLCKITYILNNVLTSFCWIWLYKWHIWKIKYKKI